MESEAEGLKPIGDVFGKVSEMMLGKAMDPLARTKICTETIMGLAERTVMLNEQLRIVERGVEKLMCQITTMCRAILENMAEMQKWNQVAGQVTEEKGELETEKTAEAEQG